MNYRHAYHAGAPADVFKHITLIALIEHLKQKDAPFMVLDTHAGTGMYDLAGIEAQKTQEAEAGILRLLQQAPQTPLLQNYIGEVEACRSQGKSLYPGSPHLIMTRLRPGDRGVFCELHPQDYAALRHNLWPFGKQAAVHCRDGAEMIGASLPPRERRGLIFIDPPFEKADEFETVLGAIRMGQKKFPSGIFALWFPIKDRAAIWRFYEAVLDTLEGETLAIEFLTQPESNGLHLNGSSMLLVNPPYGIEDVLAPALHELRALIAPAGGVRFEPLGK